MQTGISIGNHTPVSQIEAVAQAVVTIFDAAYNNSMDQETTRYAIDALVKTASVEGVTVSGATIVGDRTINVDSLDPSYS